ncbi:MAG: NADP-dependent isocitrate dehydrogenase [Clostridia bacterium]|jgi:isocitrate dehydrogenase|nr:NADP-dependent isocitrate dehydrogenase [Clostridia bacterium]
MLKIQMKTPLVEIDGDEMTRIIWDKIKKILLNPYIDLKTDYYDLGIENREITKDIVTKQAAEAIKKYGVGVKCATITPNAERVKEYSLSQMWKSPNGTIRSILDGTVFRAPIMIDGIKPIIPCWQQPIIIARHAYGDVYSGVEKYVPEGGKVYLKFPDGSELLVKELSSSGVIQAMHNSDASIKSFARSCFNFALDKKMDIWFSAKDTISKIYDHRFKDIFEEIFSTEFKEAFSELNINYFYTLIDDAIARVIRSKGGFIWACKNYDGDVMSDMLATAFGSLAMMTSVLVSPEGYYEFEAAHGTVTRHYYNYIKGMETSTNSVATIFAWSGSLRKRGQLDNNNTLIDFASKLENATIETISSGYMTKDLVPLFSKDDIKVVSLNTIDFLYKVQENLNKALFVMK